ncbi:MAG: Spo0E family sporulation regulatory protein-aspartic acid phosphatase [Bacillota bacterium]
MENSKELLIEIEKLRAQLHKIIELSGGNLLSAQVLEASQKLDRVLVTFLKNEKKL